MPYSILIHIQNTDPVMGEVDELPEKSDTMVAVKNPRRQDGKDIPYLAENVTLVYWPVDKLNYIEVLASGDEEELISFVRE